jgi:hypothetical protein
MRSKQLKDDPGNGGKPVICIGHHTINQLMAGQDVEIEAAIMVPASDLRQPTPADEISALRTRCEKAEAERDEAKASRDLQARIASDEEGLSRAAESRCEELVKALEKVCAAIEREPVVGGDLDYPHGHNDWLGWRKKIMRPAVEKVRAALSSYRKRSEADGE